MSLYGVGIDVEVKRLHLKMRMVISKRGGSGIEGLNKALCGHPYRKLCQGKLMLDVKNFEMTLGECGLFMKVVDL